MKMIVTSIFVNDQERALKFYTETLGFIKKNDVPLGEHRWLTVVSPHDEKGIELLLEPNSHPAAKEYQKKIYDDGIPATMFAVDNVQEEYEKLAQKGVKFTMKPTNVGENIIAIFDDTVGNLIQIIQQNH